jgi:hypothetical protein
MTREEFMAKYGDVKVKFSSYYKYTFTYTADIGDGKTLSVDYGGNHNEIYRFEVANDCEEVVGLLDPYAGGVYKDREKIEGFYDY